MTNSAPQVRFVKAAADKGAAGIPGLHKNSREAHPLEFDERAVNWAGYLLLNAKRIPEAIAVFNLNVEAYPDSANTYDSLSDAYIRAGDKEQAVFYRRMTLDIIPLDKKADPATLDSLKQASLVKRKTLENK